MEKPTIPADPLRTVSRIPAAAPVGRCVGAAQRPCEGRFEPMSAAEAAALADEGYNPPFELYAPPVISAVVPRGGDFRGGVTVTIHGAGFLRGVGGGGAARCGFGQPAGCDPWPAAGASVLATLRDPSTLVCASPSRESAGADEPVTVALNGQCFEGGAAHASFRFLPPLVPNGSFPSSGAVTGGAAVRVLGAGMLDVDAVS